MITTSWIIVPHRVSQTHTNIQGEFVMTKNLYFVFLVIVALFAVNVAQADSPTEVEGATTIDAATAKEFFDRSVPFIDVRNARNYNRGHVPGAIHLRLGSGAFNESSLTEVAGKDQEAVIYCNGPSCMVSSEACENAVSWGWEKIYYFRNGYPGWEAAGYSTE